MDTYTIKEVSEMFHLPSSTLRYYEDLGILTNVGRSKSGQRVYIQGHINRLVDCQTAAVFCLRRRRICSYR